MVALLFQNSWLLKPWAIYFLIIIVLTSTVGLGCANLNISNLDNFENPCPDTPLLILSTKHSLK
jgi:hypothetical protein